MNDNNSGVNTILIVLLLIIVVVGLVWFFRGFNQPAVPADDNDAGLNVNVDLPDGNTGGNDNGGNPGPGGTDQQ